MTSTGEEGIKYKVLVVCSDYEDLHKKMDKLMSALNGVKYVRNERVVCGNTTFQFIVLGNIEDCHRKMAGSEYGDVFLDDMVDIGVERYCLSRMRLPSLFGSSVLRTSEDWVEVRVDGKESVIDSPLAAHRKGASQ